MTITMLFFRILAIVILLTLLVLKVNVVLIVLISLIFYYHRRIFIFILDVVRYTDSYDSSLNKVYNESHTRNCNSCSKSMTYTKSNLYEQFGSCGGYEDGLYLTCTRCNHRNKIYADCN